MRTGHELILATKKYAFENPVLSWWHLLSTSLLLAATVAGTARLDATDPAAANLVKLRYFAGLTMPEAAAAMGVPLRTAERNWTFARTWLKRELSPEDDHKSLDRPE